jgi:putative membrane protein
VSDPPSDSKVNPVLGPSEGGAVSTPFSDPPPAASAELTGGAAPAGTVAAGTTPDFPPPPSVKEPKAPKQTFAGRVWIAIGCAAVLLVLLIIFIAENTRSVTISFLGAHGHISLGLALLVAVVAGISITLLVGSARIIQLSLEVRRHRRATAASRRAAR